MREVKFRVFDKSFEKMHIVGSDQHDSLTCFDEKIRYYNLQNGEGSGKYGDYILMQYTGLKDKNGKEIYEGDIVKFHYKKDIYKTGQVVWNNLFGSWDINCPDFVAYKSLGQFESGSEVIGNIYENPELLEESK